MRLESASARPPDLLELIPEPANLWCDAAPRTPGRKDALWLDLRSGDLAGVASSATGRRWLSRGLPRSVYVPPPAPRGGAEIRTLVARCDELGAGTLLQVVVGGESADPGAAAQVLDLTDLLVGGGWDRLETASRGQQFLWPLVPGLTDLPALVDEGLERLARRDPRAVVPVAPSLAPSTRRRLSQRCGEESFAALFHAAPASPRDFARACAARGIDFLPQRPLPAGSAPGGLEARLAAELGLVADLLSEVGESAARAQAFYRGARWLESTGYDVRGLLREGNLGVIPWMDAEIERIVEDLTGGRPRSRLLAELAERYAGRA